MGSVESPEVRKRRVIDRLALVQALIGLKVPLSKPAQLGFLPDGMYATDYDQHDSLINYLLLTCFDVLGQGVEHVSFGRWLQARELKADREEALASIKQGLPPLKVTEALHAWYNKRYGVTQGFYRFIDVMLAPDARQKLYESVGIVKHPVITNEKKLLTLKREFLYKFRNNFTHKAVAVTTVSRMADGSRLAIAEVKGAKHTARKSYKMVSGRIDKIAYFAADWPFVLYETVAGAIGEPIPEFKDSHTLVVTLSSGETGTVGNVSRADFTDPMKRAQILAAVDAMLTPRPAQEAEVWDGEAALQKALGEAAKADE